jgi:hypothetical protein
VDRATLRKLLGRNSPRALHHRDHVACGSLYSATEVAFSGLSSLAALRRRRRRISLFLSLIHDIYTVESRKKLK